MLHRIRQLVPRELDPELDADRTDIEPATALGEHAAAAADVGRELADAERRGLPALKPLLETLARSTEALRRAAAAGSESEPAPLPGKKPE